MVKDIQTQLWEAMHLRAYPSHNDIRMGLATAVGVCVIMITLVALVYVL